MQTIAPSEWTSCATCRHRGDVGFLDHSDTDTEFLSSFKSGRGALRAGARLDADLSRPMLLTLYSGWAIRLVTNESSTSILGVSLPGDLIGLETLFVDKTELRIQALTDITFCQFDPGKWHELFERPTLAARLSHIQALARLEAEERQVAATSLSATGNFCHFVLVLYEGLRRRKLAREGSFHLPLTRTQIAAALGLTAVHLRRVLAGLAEDRVLECTDGRVVLWDLARVRALAGNPRLVRDAQPLL